MRTQNGGDADNNADDDAGDGAAREALAGARRGGRREARQQNAAVLRLDQPHAVHLQACRSRQRVSCKAGAQPGPQLSRQKQQQSMRQGPAEVP